MTITENPEPSSPSSQPVKAKNSGAWILILMLPIIGVIAACEWRYSDDMQQHINAVNHDLAAPGSYGGDLLGALSDLTRSATVAREIAETQEHVHTLKDWMLARKIKQVVQEGGTVAEAMGRLLGTWQQNFAEPREAPPTASSPTQPETSAASSTPAPTATESKPADNWQVDHDTNPVTGIITTVAYLRAQGKQNIYIRQRGNQQPVCYINTDQFLETIDNMETRNSTVQYRLDDGKPVLQTWNLSDDNLALFYPGSCGPFIAKLRASKRLAFEYKPNDRIETTLTFDVEALPDEFNAVGAPGPRRQTQPRKDPPLPMCADQDWKLPCRT